MPLAQRGVVFDDARPVIGAHPNRADIACLIGFVGVRPDIAAGNLPADLEQDLREAGWIDSAYARAGARQLLDVPVTVESWERFDLLFAWDQRPVSGSADPATTWLGAAVRSFFAEGGRQCVIVRAGDPDDLGPVLRGDQLDQRIAKLIPGYPFLLDTSASDRTMWSGFGHLAGMPEVSFVSFPDLPELCADPAADPPPRQVVLNKPEEWVECSDESADAKLPRFVGYPSPRSGRPGYARWSLALSFAIRYLSRYRRDVQLVASLPRPLSSSDIANLFTFLIDENESGVLSAGPDLKRDGIASAFTQLAYPWLQTAWSNDLAESIEPPEGVLLGLLARNALTEGAYRSAARIAPATIADFVPSLTRIERLGLLNGDTLQDRVSLFGFSPDGIRLLSDNTASLDASYRPAAVNRLVNVLVRAAQQAGEEAMFENSGEDLWAEMEERISALLQRLYELGALRGATPEDAYDVRCDSSTMSQNDIDNGRLVVEVQFQASLPIELITVRLAYEDGGQVTATLGAAA
jgi:hypothetical protein